MPCFFIAVGFFVPRIALFLMLLTGYAGQAFASLLWPVLGFFFLPYTTCAYAIGMNTAGGLDGWPVIMLVIAVLLDFGVVGGGASSARRAR